MPSDASISRSAVEFPQEKRVAESVTICFTSNLVLTSMFAKERGEDSLELSLTALEQNIGLKNPTLLNYLVMSPQILQDLNTTNRIDLITFAKSFHYPVVRVAHPSIDNHNSLSSIGSDEENPIVSSILEELSTAADAFASKFAQNVCMDADSIIDRDTQLRESIGELRGVLEEAQNEIMSTGTYQDGMGAAF